MHFLILNYVVNKLFSDIFYERPNSEPLYNKIKELI